MVAPLIALASALISKKMQDQEQKNVYEEELRRENAAAQARIAERRAQRAGDSGYMQQAANSIGNFSPMPASNSGRMLAQVGEALLSQRKEPQPENKPIKGPTDAELDENRVDYEPDRDNYYV